MALLPNSGPTEVEDAVRAAAGAFPAWSCLSPETRGRYLLKIADMIDSNLESLALAESRDQGKPVSLARSLDIPRAALNFRKFAFAWQGLTETSNKLEAACVVNISSRQPLGVAGLISPWNLPLYLLTFKIAPAIMSGNTVVCKPSEMTSVTAWMLCKMIKDIGLPPGVVNMVFGYGSTVGESIVTHPEVKIVSFTGLLISFCLEQTVLCFILLARLHPGGTEDSTAHSGFFEESLPGARWQERCRGLQ